MSTKTLHTERFEITTRTTGVPLRTPIKRYRRASGSGITHPEHEPGLVLFFAHGAGFSKELWEPTIEDLFQADDEAARAGGSRTSIREAWGIDCGSHGEAGVLNEQILVEKPFLPIYDYGDAFAQLATSKLLGSLDPKSNKIIMLGHSAGGVGAVLATMLFYPTSNVPFSSIILIEPAMVAPSSPENEMYKMVAAMTPQRRDIWDTREAARRYFEARIPWAAWDARVLDRYIEHGLRELPTAHYPDKKVGVTLTTHKNSEALPFNGTKEALDALHRLDQICGSIPVHLVFGDRNDFYSRENQDSLISPVEGRVFASVTWIEDAGHLVVQESPKKLASALLPILLGISTKLPVLTSKL